MKKIKFFIFIFLAFFAINIISVNAEDVKASVTIIVSSPTAIIYDLTVTKADMGTGTVTGSSTPTQPNISCGISCTTESKSYSSGT